MPRNALDSSILTLQNKVDTTNTKLTTLANTAITTLGLLNGEKNAWSSQFALYDGPASTGGIILDTSANVTTQYLCPASNKSVKIVSDNLGDNGTVLIRGVKKNGDAINESVPLNGTTEVILTNQMIFVNSVEYESGTAILGTLTVYVQTSGWEEVGRYRNNHWSNPRYLVPNSRRGAVLSFKGLNGAIANVYLYELKVFDDYLAGSAQNRGITKCTIYQPTLANQTIVANPCVFKSGTLIFLNYYCDGSNSPSIDFSYVEYDE